METKTENQKPNLVLGRVTDKQNRPLPNLSVHIYDRDMRSEQLLKETVTDKEGRYEVAWLHSQLSGRGVKEADISVKVFTRENKTLLYASDIDSIRFNASSREEINIIIPDAIKPEIVEYDSILKPIINRKGS